MAKEETPPERVIYHEVDAGVPISQGDIFGFCPIHWLQLPLYLVRPYVFRKAQPPKLLDWKQVSDAFKNPHQNYQERIVADAKLRFLIVLSGDIERYLHDRIVAPMYTLKPEKFERDQLDALKKGTMPGRHYLPPSRKFAIEECYVGLRNVQLMNTDFLNPEQRVARLDRIFIQALIEKYREYLAAL